MKREISVPKDDPIGCVNREVGLGEMVRIW
jgi:hypothetical protein